MRLLIIPSAKLVDPALQTQFGRIPSALIPLDGKCSFEIIYDRYESFFDEILIIGHEEYGRLEKVINPLNFPKIRLIYIPRLQDIGFTVHYALQQIELNRFSVITINYADTLINNISLSYIDNSTLIVGYVQDFNNWAVLDRSDSSFVIRSKDQNDFTLTREAIAGFFSFSNPQLLYNLLSNAIKNENFIEESFYKAVMDYHQQEQMQLVDNSKWLDFGHSDNYQNVRREVDSRFFNSIQIDRKRGLLTKTSSDVRKFVNEIQWYLKLPIELQWLIPRIFDYSLSFMSPFVKMEYYSYNTLHDIFLFGNCSLSKWKVVFNCVFDILNEFSKYRLTLSSDELSKIAYKMYHEKTKDRLEQLNGTTLYPFLENEFSINNCKFPPLSTVFREIDCMLRSNGVYEPADFCIIHGDLFFANMLIDINSNIIRLVDPRGDFGGYGIYGDPRYDLAKLAHSIDGLYDFIVKDLFTLSVVDNDINYSIKYDDNHVRIKNLFYSYFTQQQVVQLKLIQCTLFLSMIPLHNDQPPRQHVMLGTAMRLYNEVLEAKSK